MVSVAGRTLLAALAGVCVLALALLVPEGVLARVRGVVASPWFPLILVGLYVVRPFLAWPVSALSVLVGYKYGLALGVPVALLGAAGTSLIPYYVGDRLPTAGRVLGRVRSGGERYFAAAGDTRGVVAARLAPTPAEVVSAGAGIAGVPLRAFVAGTLVGELPWTIAAVGVGASLESFSLRSAFDPVLVGACVLLAALLLARPLYRSRRR
ncbi:TVP38/TMEM64 family protein [Salarchaeum sp. JOR-1]|uniref:TVP38/TMEM64 family protein n=1 Tax=Salarchaeum sp. JOR-1 TaxID=2599399 RepID=UPI001198A6AE|nr:VTT domain-containing protein [Salarchaeum sp. JOR-1]QDX40605.1 TVP38/TMEM64 family protein [Salarchaeum sp. JOR-1]